jgi:hypothetical protein
MNVIEFKEWKCHCQFAKYGNGRTAIQLMNADPIDDGEYISPPGTEQIATATVNIPEVDLKDNEVIIKDYSENEGMLKSLILGNVVHMPHKYVKTGHVECPVCILKILPQL